MEHAQKGYVMSLHQLNELWHYDMELAHILMDLPRRTCTAQPEDLPDIFPSMSKSSFSSLKNQIRRMWILASLHFKAKQSSIGWGMYCSSDKLPFTLNKPAVFGWLAKAPGPEISVTGHRYLRSPCEGGIYLGGPISLANWDNVGRVICRRASTVESDSVNHNKMLVYRVNGQSLKPEDEIFWTYNLSAVDTQNFYPEEEWHLVQCCASNQQEQLFAPITGGGAADAKKRRSASEGPLKTMQFVKDFNFCTYCGENLAHDLEKGAKVNIKRHWAVKHTLSLCQEMGMEGAKGVEVSSKGFLLHLDAIDHVIRSLHSHHYQVIPASHFLKHMATQNGQDRKTEEEIFSEFLVEAKAAFQKYKVLYLHGINVPTCYQDLLPDETSNFRSVKWHSNQKPPHNNYSINSLHLTEEERDLHNSAIEVLLKSIVMGCEMMGNCQ